MSKKGRSKYEGMFHSGQKFGEWTVLVGKVKLDDRGRATVNCYCSCSDKKSYEVSCKHLLSGKSTRCKVCNLSKGRLADKNPNWKGINSVPKTTLTTISHSAARSGVDYNLTTEYVSDLYTETGGTCTFTGATITPGKDADLVPLDPNEGYVLGNVVWVHNSVANSIKSMGAEKFKTTCYAVYNHTKENE